MNSQCVQGPDNTLGQGNAWRVTQGDPYLYDYDTSIIVSTAYESGTVDLAAIYALRNCVNDSDMWIQGFGSLAAGTVLLPTVMTRHVIGYDLVDVDYVFQWSGPYEEEAWNNGRLKSQLGTWAVQEVPVIDSARKVVKDSTGKPKKRHRTIWLPDYYWSSDANGGEGGLVSSEEETRTPFRTASFAAANGLVQW
jgi:hypothetical protein